MSIDPVHYARRWKTLAVLSLSLLIIGLDNTILNVALPSLQEEFGASSSTLQWIVDSYLLVFAGLLLTMGTLGDRFGRKRALQAGLLLFGGASLGVLLVDSADQLILVRALMGVGGALIMPATLSIITNVFPREERGKAIGIWAGMASVGIGLGPLTGGLLLEWFSWQSVFLVNVPVAFAALAAGFWLVPESRDPQPGAFDVPGAVLSTGALVTLVFGVIEAPEAGWLSPQTLGCFAGFIALAARCSSPGSCTRRRRCSTCPSSATRASRSRRRRSASRSSASSVRSSRSRSSCSTRSATRRWRPAPRWCRSPSAS